MQVLREAAGKNGWVELSLMAISETFDAPELVSKSLLVLDEVGEAPKSGRALSSWKTGWRFLKRLVGNDPLAGRDMYSTVRRPFRAHCNVVITDNDAPHIAELQGDSEAWYDRLIPIPFTRTFTEGTREKHLGDFIVNEEIADVVAICLKKWAESEERRTGKFILDDEMESLRKEMTFTPFSALDEILEPNPDSVLFIPEMKAVLTHLLGRKLTGREEFRKLSKDVCRKLGVSSETVSARNFRGKRTRHYEGIGWVDEGIKEELYEQLEL